MKKYYALLFVLLSTWAGAQVINIPDPVFKSMLLASGTNYPVATGWIGLIPQLDANANGEIEVSEVQNVGGLNLNNSGIADLTGIEYFVNLRTLNCGNNQLTSINLSTLVNLTHIYVPNNQLTSLNLSPITTIKQIDAANNQITALDLSAQTLLNRLDVSNNQLTVLNLDGLVNIGWLDCRNNNLTALNIADYTAISSMNCSHNALTSLTFHRANSGSSSWMNLDCSYNQLQQLLFTGIPVTFSMINAENNQLTSLDLSTTLGPFMSYSVNLRHNLLTQLILPQGISIGDLYLDHNQLSELNLGTSWAGERIFLNDNLFTTVDYTLSSSSSYIEIKNNPLEHVHLTFPNGNSFAMSGIAMSEPIADLTVTGNIHTLIFDNINTVAADFSQIKTAWLQVAQCPNLQQLNVKNGTMESLWLQNGAPQLQYICADEEDVQNFVNAVSNPNLVVNSYCTFVPGGQFSEIIGSTTFDSNNNGCDSGDYKMPFAKYTISNGPVTGQMTANADGDYSIPVQTGTHTITPVFEHPTYFNVSPAAATIPVGATSSTIIQQFCLAANGIHADLEMTLLPLSNLRPGFDTTFKIVYKNKGNQMLSGNILFTFDYRSEFVSASVTPVALTATTAFWHFTNLNPFEVREIFVVVNINSPVENPAVNGGDVLDFSANITAADTTDETPEDNSQQLNIAVVNSFDPNDKACLEGTIINPSMVGKYVHYMIRFENTGTAPAQNIVVVDEIDANKFDVSSLIALSGSHDFYTRINGNKVEFIFENIQLPFDDANNDGYVSFKIKTKPTLVVGDSFSNSASIYFDYNHPIVTDPAVTTVSLLKTQDFEFSDAFAIYPNPAADVLNVQSKTSIKISSAEVYNMLGQLVLSTVDANGISKIDVSHLKTGNYFIKIHSDKGETHTKFIKSK